MQVKYLLLPVLWVAFAVPVVYGGTHRMTVAAGKGISLTNEQVDLILTGMNKIMEGAAYSPWDKECAEVRFERAGDLITHSDLLTTGEDPALFASLKSLAPSANVLVVESMTCSGSPGAAGCGVIGTEPMIVQIYAQAFNSSIWLHERGHNVGLLHSGDSGTDKTVAPEIGKRFMFWQVNVDHTGKTETDCARFEQAKFSSVVPMPSSPNDSNLMRRITLDMPRGLSPSLKVADAAMPLSTPSPAGTPVISSPITTSISAPDELMEQLANESGLTRNAFDVIGPPWMHGRPDDQIKALNASDIDSIRRLLDKAPSSDYSPHATFAIGLVGNLDDALLLIRTASRPLPAMGPDASPSSVTAMRNLRNAKLAVPRALSDLTQRTQSSVGVDALIKWTNSENATALVGKEYARDFSKNSLLGLANTPTLKAAVFVRSVINLQTSASLIEPVKKIHLEAARVVPLTLPEAAEVSKRSIASQQNLFNN